MVYLFYGIVIVIPQVRKTNLIRVKQCKIGQFTNGRRVGRAEVHVASTIIVRVTGRRRLVHSILQTFRIFPCRFSYVHVLFSISYFGRSSIRIGTRGHLVIHTGPRSTETDARAFQPTNFRIFESLRTRG